MADLRFRVRASLLKLISVTLIEIPDTEEFMR